LRSIGVLQASQVCIKDLLPHLETPQWWNQFSSMNEVKNKLLGDLSNNACYIYTRKYRPDLIGTGFTVSFPHQKVIDLLNQYQIAYEVNTRKIISPKELDIFIPSKKIAIEINGIYWHSELNGKDKTYHLNKTEECEKQDIQLLQFWDIEVEQKWDIVSSMLLSKIGVSLTKIGARHCSLGNTPKQQEQDFLNQYHLQGYTPSTVCLGLYYKNELVSLMSFGKPRFSRNVDWELLRFCNKINTQVIGGASKLFSRRPNGSILSYSDRRYSLGFLYEKLGLNQIRTTCPSYYYLKGGMMENRMKYQKHKLPRLLETFDPSLTEWENMQLNGYDRVWDCRNYGLG
jgi:very-short-patch-repair endonuclease